MNNVVVVFNPDESEIKSTQFLTAHWSTAHHVLYKEDVTSNVRAPIDICFTIRAFVDSDHAIMFIKNAYTHTYMIFFFSKKQGFFETSSFGSDIIAMKSYSKCLRILH